MEKLQEIYDVPSPAELELLFVDDEATARQLVPRILKEAGYQNITTTSSSREALELLEKGSYHILICDLMMPEMDGMQLLMKIRATPKLANLSVVVLSAVEDLSVVYKCLQNGADDYITKPMHRGSVRNLWSNVLRKKKEKHVLQQLDEEKAKRLELNEELETMKVQMRRIDSQMATAVETPISVIMTTVKELQATDGLTDNVKSALSTMMMSLKSSDLYKPAIDKFLESEDLDPVASAWVKEQLLLEEDCKDITLSMVQEEDTVARTQQQKQLRGYEWDVWKSSEQDLFKALHIIFTDLNLPEAFSVDKEKLHNFFVEVSQLYNANPYHNFRHAVDVTQSIYSYLTTGGAAKQLTRLEIFALLISAMGHDLGHKGFNNPFLVATSDPLALRYNDISVLENFHCSLLFSLLKKAECSICEGLSKSEYALARKMIISNILATDMSKHVEIMNKVQAIQGNFEPDNQDHRQLFLNLLMKCADVANPTRPFKAAKYWAEMLREEIFIQGDKERELGMKVSMFMDREDKNAPLAKMQTGFADFVLLPMYKSLNDFLPQTQPLSDRLLRNRETWGSLDSE
mmetsp:Transcript_1112/g.3990  ORF Transcript_1112/g.3990 Transcript_1112/m.3990 type:complete len:575 (+) Transcript_1112:113-1837(+)